LLSIFAFAYFASFPSAYALMNPDDDDDKPRVQGGAGAGAGGEVTEGVQCPRCTFLNAPTSTACEMCEHIFPQAGGAQRHVGFGGFPRLSSAVGSHRSISVQKWQCFVCDFMNLSGVRECFGCGIPSGVFDVAASAVSAGASRVDGAVEDEFARRLQLFWHNVALELNRRFPLSWRGGITAAQLDMVIAAQPFNPIEDAFRSVVASNGLPHKIGDYLFLAGFQTLNPFLDEEKTLEYPIGALLARPGFIFIVGDLEEEMSKAISLAKDVDEALRILDAYNALKACLIKGLAEESRAQLFYLAEGPSFVNGRVYEASCNGVDVMYFPLAEDPHRNVFDCQFAPYQERVFKAIEAASRRGQNVVLSCNQLGCQILLKGFILRREARAHAFDSFRQRPASDSCALSSRSRELDAVFSGRMPSGAAHSGACGAGRAFLDPDSDDELEDRRLMIEPMPCIGSGFADEMSRRLQSDAPYVQPIEEKIAKVIADIKALAGTCEYLEPFLAQADATYRGISRIAYTGAPVVYYSDDMTRAQEYADSRALLAQIRMHVERAHDFSSHMPTEILGNCVDVFLAPKFSYEERVLEFYSLFLKLHEFYRAKSDRLESAGPEDYQETSDLLCPLRGPAYRVSRTSLTRAFQLTQNIIEALLYVLVREIYTTAGDVPVTTCSWESTPRALRTGYAVLMPLVYPPDPT
jgi:hypothetical protein